jgi:hypothetical protein
VATPAGLRISAYDQVAGTLISLLIVFGVGVLLLFIVWLTSRLLFAQKSIPIELVNYEGRGDHAAGFERDMEEPGMDELEELTEPQLENTLEKVTEVITTQVASFDQLEAAAYSSQGSGRGDSRQAGPEGEGSRDIIPPWERWEIRFTSSDVNAYARQLDSFGIELGAAGGAPEVDYAGKLAGAQPQRRSGKPEAEDRLYMTYRGGTSPLAAFDKQLLEKTGIRTQRRLILQFYPKEIEHQLAVLEATHAKGRSAKEFLKTIFGVKERRGGGYEFYVIDMLFRPPPAL